VGGESSTLRALHGVLIGFALAVISAALVFGEFAVALAEYHLQRSVSLAAPTQTLSPSSPSETPSPTSTAPPTQLPTANIPPAPTETPATSPEVCLPPADWTLIIISEGQTLETLAATYQVTEETLLEGNCRSQRELLPNTIFYVPPSP